MPLLRRETPDGTAWVRPPFRPEDYTAPEEAVRWFERWRGDGRNAEAILADRESPFANFVEVGRRTEGDQTWITLLEASREFALDVEALRTGFGDVVPLPPRRAYELACARDPLRSKPVIREG